jgi:hypothetical protein
LLSSRTVGPPRTLTFTLSVSPTGKWARTMASITGPALRRSSQSAYLGKST